MKATEEDKRRMKEWYQKNKERHLVYHRDQWKNNKEKLQKRQKKYYDSHSAELRAKASIKWKLPKGRFINYTSGAKNRGISFDLTFEEFMTFWQKPCWYCDDPIDTIGLDRIDSARGYSLSNVIPCCESHNKGKMDLDQEEFILGCNRVAKKHPRTI